MRVALVSQEVPPQTAWGGIGTYVDVLSGALAEQGVEDHVLSVVEGQRRSTSEHGGVTVHRFALPRVRGPGRVAPESWRRMWLPAIVGRALARLGLAPDVVECPEWNAEGLALALRGRVPLVVRLHSSARQLFPYTGQGKRAGGFDGRGAALLEELSARRANAVVSTRSNLDEVAARMRLDPRALHAIPYPVRLPAPSPMPAGGPAQVTFVGRLEPRKAPEVVLAAAPRVLAAVPDARFVFVGRDGTAPGSRSSAAWLAGEAERLGVAHAVRFRGQVDREGLAEELRRATVCAFPSRWESFGNVVAEASAVGRPVVVSAIPPFAELVRDGSTGRIVPLDDLDGWAQALTDALRDTERAGAMGEAGAALVARISDPGRVAELALASYEDARARWARGERAGSR
jgi:glycosyltransferase involved in cell wall biosynthesis